MTKFQILVAVIAWVTSCLAVASDKPAHLRVTVVDQNNRPLQQAVVSSNTRGQQELVEPSDSGTAIMDQVNKLFVPFILTVPENSLVSFPNSDNIRHQVYSFSTAKPFELPLYSNREAPQLYFESAGVVVLGCNIHDHMKAYIYVSPHPFSVTTNAQGQVQLPAEDQQLYFWYPGMSEALTDEIVIAVSAEQSELQVQLPVVGQAQNPPPASALQQRFNQLKNRN